MFSNHFPVILSFGFFLHAFFISLYNMGDEKRRKNMNLEMLYFVLFGMLFLTSLMFQKS